MMRHEWNVLRGTSGIPTSQTELTPAIPKLFTPHNMMSMGASCAGICTIPNQAIGRPHHGNKQNK